MTKLSIIIPVYNVEMYIHKTLESIFSQSYPINSLEIIVVNDGTPDNSMSIVSDFASKYDNLRIIEQENQGLSCARNTGLSAAQGEYVWFVDSDDWIEDGCIGKILLLLNGDIDVFMFKIREYDEEGNVLLTRSFHDNENIEYTSGTDVIFYEKKYGVDITPMQQYIIRRQFLLEHHLTFIPRIYHEDKEFAPRMLILSNNAEIIPWVAYCYLRRMSGSITSDKSLMKKRFLSKGDIYNRHTAFASRLSSSKDKRAISYYKGRMVSFIWNQVDLDFIKSERLLFQQLMPSFKKDIWNNLFYDHKLKHLLRQVIFLINPMLLKKLNKDL